ncbi:hypothetical protein DSM104299_03196 [Baekduia alba]|uniref:hypothetical protein n=1 Tax=Baekduia alba TaxID=2997333 RepID=UPI002340505E|nr:hypothetical protein [Baekduia alba]WCB94459.1 hypothetical protein DSM104299_03196 [Baekduia alba]
MQAAINEHLLSIVALFAEEGHSGGSAGYAIGMLQRLLSFEPITPLTGDDSEWVTVVDGPSAGMERGLEQNLRCSHVFREDGVAYDIEAVVYRERNGGGFTGWDSARRVTFPYTPSTRTVPAWLRWPERFVARLRRQLRP